ncbi:helix-turn-helix domain-containing protein [Streptomyces sp. NPDC127190]|uniref:AraC-like ligand-binding domain-containing protein n=1 Tax=unclassified Streptomyces TaxID=2593676 RepID=UPI00362B056F
MPVTARTDDHPPADRLEMWRETVRRTPVPVDVTAPAGGDVPFRAEVSAAALGAVQVATVASGPGQAVRTRRLIERADDAFLLVGVVAEGTVTVAQDGRTSVLRAGDAACWDSTRPFTLRFDDDFRLHEFTLPHRLARQSPGTTTPVTATRLAADDPLGSLLAPFLSRLAEDAGRHAASPRATLLSDAVADMVAAVFPDPPRPADTGGAALCLRIKAFIDQRLADPDLSPGELAAAHGISLRYLHKLFAEEGTSVGAWIRQRRLAGARRDLSGPHADRRTVAAVAARWGFRDPSHFSRLFKQTYGIAPRELRARA